jgi:hypothetical protein
MKNIFFPQQRKLNCNYLPLRWGLKQYTDEQIETLASMFKPDAPDNPKKKYCPKIYTTRTKPLRGIYRIVEGGRFHPEPVYDPIIFQVDPEPVYDPIIFQVDGTITMTLNLHTEIISYDGEWASGQIHSSTCYWGLDKKPWTLPELDMGIIGATFEDLRDELLKSYPKANSGTPFYVSKLEPVGGKPLCLSPMKPQWQYSSP